MANVESNGFVRDATTGALVVTGTTTPSGAAGGSLAGTYPNPSIAAKAVSAAEIADALKPSVSATAGTEALRKIGHNVGDAGDGSLWRMILADGSSIPAAAAIGDYVQSALVGSTISASIGGMLNTAMTSDFGTNFRFRTVFYAALGAADPTGTITVSVYSVTVNIVAAGAGISYTLGSLVTGAQVSQAAPVRGTIYNLTSSEFTLTPGSVYQFVVSVSGANMPASSVIRPFHVLEARGT